jgi:hypothetical protein
MQFKLPPFVVAVVLDSEVYGVICDFGGCG